MSSKKFREVDEMEIDESQTVSSSKKEGIDYSKETKKLIEDSDDSIKKDVKNLKGVLENLLNMEKKCRLAADNDSTSMILVEIVKLCADCQAWKELNENLLMLSKKRQQSKIAISKMVQKAMEYIDKTPSKGVKIDLIECLQKVTEGKIFVEVERARLARILAELYEKDGKISEAAELLLDVQIETISSMEPAEKIEFILRHFRLTLDAQDYVRAIIVAKKITERSLRDFPDLRIQYYQLMIRFHTHNKEYLDVCKCYLNIFETKRGVALESVKKKDVAISDDVVLSYLQDLESSAFFLILSPYDQQQADLIHRILTTTDKSVLEHRKMELSNKLLRIFSESELINLPRFKVLFYDALGQHSAFNASIINVGSQNIGSMNFGKERFQDLENRIVEHNIRVIAQHYTCIRMQRLSEILFLSEEKAEEFISKMVNNKTISAKIDRLEATIRFLKYKTNNEILNNWSADTVKLLSLVERCGHLINKEMVEKGVINHSGSGGGGWSSSRNTKTESDDMIL